MKKDTMKGKVFLIGAGPGDPGLITVKGKECISRADVIIYDYLASPSLLAFAAPSAERIYVGKKGGDHTLAQDGINSLLVEKAKQGKVVARLKGGDPFIFGRGGEEAEVLIEAGIPFEIVPGVTSAIAAPAYAGIPLTHRKFTTTVAFVTGHETPGKEKSGIDWESLARGIGTLVFLMGVKNLPEIAAKLMASGKPPDTPVALIRWGTTAKQQTVTGTLSTIVEKVAEAGLKSPSIIVVGDVVTLRESMQWFENRPLTGKRIVVTRAREQASDLVRLLSDLGAECLEFPTIKVVPMPDCRLLDKAIDDISSYDYLVFTSVNGVTFFLERLFEKGLDARCLGHIRTVAIGPSTSARLRQYGLNTDILPESYRAESVIAAFEKEPVQGKRVLLPRAKDARPVLPVELTKMGATVDEIITYAAIPVSENTDELIRNLHHGNIDMITFTSSSTVTNFKALLPDREFEALMKNVMIAGIGPITADTARDLGFHVDITADEFTIPGLVTAILNHVKGLQ
jgi:uroporphyrinogen III methyltransferase/synthase